MVRFKDRTWLGFHSAISRVALFSVTVGLLFFASSPAFAAGGSCPSGNVTIDSEGNPITLSSLGITSCFYVSKSTGSDTNAGTTEAAPWAHLPGMPSCTGTCASTTPAAGEGFILRGGDTWTSSDLGIQWTHGGTSSNNIYIGVDTTTPWYNSSTCGSSWCRPIFNAGAANPGDILDPAGSGYIVVDNIEITGTVTNEYVFMAYNATGPFRVTRVYVHGWSHAGGGNNAGVFGKGGAGTLADHFIIDGSDSSQNTQNGFYIGWSQIQYGYISYVVSGVLGNTDVVHDNVVNHTVLSADGDHCNGIFTMSPDTGNGQIIYNNVIDNGSSSGPCQGGVVLWFNGNGSTSTGWVNYGFNNVMWSLTSNPVDVGNHGSGPYGNYYWFNNTVDCTVGGCGGTPPSGPYWTIYDQNNQSIGGALDFTCSGCTVPVCSVGSGTGCTDLNQSESTANGQGYSSSETYPYEPTSSCTSSTCGTVQHGTNVASYCTALSAINADAGTACKSSTTDACSYNTSNHTLSCPADTPIARPASGAWDVGAYQFGASDPVTPPSGLQAIVN